ncbi:MAG: hypothetical protein GX989_04205 [Firmicutes bacterium]|nr:hypothetical protein [Bacillota bacterium]
MKRGNPVAKAYGRIGGIKTGNDIILLGTDTITGRVGDPLLGFSCQI